jgi:hypothetical protein
VPVGFGAVEVVVGIGPVPLGGVAAGRVAVGWGAGAVVVGAGTVPVAVGLGCVPVAVGETGGVGSMGGLKVGNGVIGSCDCGGGSYLNFRSGGALAETAGL